MTNLNAINQTCVFFFYAWQLYHKRFWLFASLDCVLLVNHLNDWLYILYINLCLIKQQSFVSAWKHRMQSVALLIMSYLNNESQLYWHCCHFTLGSMRGKVRYIYIYIKKNRKAHITLWISQSIYDTWQSSLGFMLDVKWERLWHFYWHGGNPSCPSLSASNVPGSAEANGGLQEDPLLRKEASSLAF